MKYIIIAAICCLAIFSSINAQEIEKSQSVSDEKSVSVKIQLAENFPIPDFIESSEEEQIQKKQTDLYVRPSAKKRFNYYVKNTVGLNAFAKSIASAGFTTITNNPEEWERTGEGFGRRFASNMGRNAIEQTVTYGLDETLKVNSKYYKSPKKDFGSRTKNAFLSVVTARNKEGKRVLGTPRIVGVYSSHIIAREAWFPDRYNYRDGLRSGTISLGITAAFNLFREFF